MPTPSPAIVLLLSAFADPFTAPTWRHALVLLYGTILAPGARTVAAALRAMGLAHERHFTTYHRVLNRAPWSARALSHTLLTLLCATFLAGGAPLVLLIDDTLERRGGRTIAWKGRFRDPVRSTGGTTVTSEGLRWVCLMALVPVPWSSRPWALPLLSVPALAPATSQKWGKRQRTTVDRADVLIRLVRRWQPDREIVLVGDGGYAAVSLGHTCGTQRRPVTFCSRLRTDAALYDPPLPQPPSKRGPKPKKGARQSRLAARVTDAATVWAAATVPWYGGGDKEVELATGTALWHRSGLDPLPLRWVLVRCPQGSVRPLAFFCPDENVAPAQVVAWYISRWNIEVTFEEMRAHLGFETQRQWSDRAIARTTPCLLGLFSLVALMAQRLHPDTLPTRVAAWYPKTEATFADALAAVRHHRWTSQNYNASTPTPELELIPRDLWQRVYDAACYAAYIAKVHYTGMVPAFIYESGRDDRAGDSHAPR